MAQGSTISVNLFAIKINSLSKVISREIHASMFADDVRLATRTMMLVSSNELCRETSAR